jgi:hypothetical protein
MTRHFVNEAMGLDARDPVALQALGDLALSEGRVEDADAAAQTGLALEPASEARRFRVLTLAGLRGEYGYLRPNAGRCSRATPRAWPFACTWSMH